MSFGEKLQELRKKRGLSQEQLAQEMGVSRQAISKWETGEGLPDTERVILLAKFFDTSIDHLLIEAQEEESKRDNTKDYKGQDNISSTNSYINKAVGLIKRKGFIAGYIIAFYGLIAFGMGRFAHMSFKSMLLPEGFDITLAQLPTYAKTPLYLSNIISIFGFVIIIVGIYLAYYLKKKGRE